ncbi:MAG TPA: hypothetical protein VM871_04740 [Flavisolibacter sp.]|jgi:hypothetical protein|nr:hypothetical protein [Flavisolibacter sp.]
MRKLLPLLTFLFLLGCSKEKFPQTIPGTWTIIESNIGTGTGYTVQTYAPSSETTIEFASNGTLVLTGINPGTAMSPLWEFDRYEIEPDNKIRFYQTSGGKEMEAFFTLNGELYLNYLWARCGYEEKFLKLR